MFNGTIVNNVCENPDTYVEQTMAEGVRGRVTNLFEECVGILSLVMSALATSYILRRWGARRSLTFFSYLCLAGLIAPWLLLVGDYGLVGGFSGFAIRISFWISFIIVAVQKASVFDLFRPLMEILYLPTSDAVRYKARVWIDTIGPVVSGILTILVLYRTEGDIGLNSAFQDVGFILFEATAGVLFVLISRMMGQRFEQYIENGYIVGVDPSFEEIAMTDDDNDEDEGIEHEMNPSQGGNRNAETQARNIIL